MKNLSLFWVVLAATLLLGGLIYLLAPVLTPFLAGGFLAYLGDPLADRLEAWHFSRTGAVIVVFLVIFTMLWGLLFVLLPLLGAQIHAFVETLPDYFQWLNTHLAPWVQKHLGITMSQYDSKALLTLLSSHLRQASGYAGNLASMLSRSGLMLLGWLANLILIPIVTFYLLRDWDHMVDYLHDLLPMRYRSTASRLALESDAVLGAFLRGQLAVMIALGIVYSVGLWFVGLKIGILIGVLAGLVSFVPYLGFSLGVVAALLAMFMQTHSILGLWPVAVVFAIGQVLESAVFTPMLVGDRIGLHPVMVIFAILAGGQLFGFGGVLLALPVTAVLAVFIRHLHERYRQSRFFQT